MVFFRPSRYSSVNSTVGVQQHQMGDSMRWICFLLLFANIGYGLWSAVYVHAQPYPDENLLAAAPAGSSSGGEPLVLIDELLKGDASETEQDFIAPSLKSSAPEIARLAVAPQSTAPQSTAPQSTDSQAVAPLKVDPLASESTASEVLDARQKPLTETNELSEALNDRPAMCWAAGPILQPTAADHLAKRALALGDQVKTKTLNVKTGEEFWVYLKPLVSHKAALAKLRELQAQKIDSFIVTRGQYKHAISLGLFSKAESAKQHQANMKSKGLEPMIEVRDRTRREFWVQFHLNQKLETTTKERLQGELDALQWQPVRCETELAADL